MAYYGIANFAQGFNTARDTALTSGLNEDKQFQQNYLSNYQMPAEMTASDLAETQGNINLDKLSADNRVAQLQSEAVGQGMTNPNDIADYIRSNVDYGETAANPYLASAVLNTQRQAAQGLVNQGGALGGALGASVINQGLSEQGLPYQQQVDANGNVYFTDANGNRSDLYSRAGQVPIAQAFGGNVTPIQAYSQGLEKQAYDSASLQAQLQAGKYDQRTNAAEINALRSLYIAQVKTNPVAAAQTLRLINARLAGQTGQTLPPSGLDVITGNASLPTGAAPMPGQTAATVPSYSATGLQPPLPATGIPAPASTAPFGIPAAPVATVPPSAFYGVPPSASASTPAQLTPGAQSELTQRVTQDALAGRDLTQYSLPTLQSQYSSIDNAIRNTAFAGRDVSPSLITIRSNLDQAIRNLQAAQATQQDAASRQQFIQQANTPVALPPGLQALTQNPYGY